MIKKLNYLRDLFLSSKTEAFRERAKRMKESFWQQSKSAQVLYMLYKAYIINSITNESEQQKEYQSLINKITNLYKDNELNSYDVSELGLAAIILGDLKLAKKVMNQSTKIQPISVYSYFRQGTLSAIQDKYEEAIKYLKKGLEIDSSRSEVWANLAHVYYRQVEITLAENAYIKAWELRPANKSFAIKALDILTEIEKFNEYKIQLENHKEQITDNSKKSSILSQLALLTEYEGNINESLPYINEAVVLNETNEEIRHLYSELFLTAERYWILGEKLVDWVKNYDVFNEHLSLAQCRKEAGFVTKAKEGLQEIKDRAFGDPEWDNLWAECLMEEDNYIEAKSILEQIMSQYPDHIQTINLLADVYSSLGEMDKANNLTEKVADIAPGPLIRQLENKKNPTQEDIKRLKNWLDDINDKQLKTNIKFTLAHVYDKCKEYKKSADNLKQANKEVWESIDYDINAFKNQINKIIDGFDSLWLESRQNKKNYAIKPLYIIGMPRSGTTLLEQIFAAHPHVYGGGELPIMPKIRNLAHHITKKKWPHSILESDSKLVADAGQYYIDEALKTMNFKEKILVDKLPHNFMDAGLLCAMFNNVKIIALRRDFHAVALSNYMQNFAAKKGMLGYSFDLHALGHHIKDFNRLMTYWQKILPAEKYREFHYEELVSNPKKIIPEVLEFCNLDFTPEVLEFYKNKTAVKTASVRQVRNPIYTGSIEKWKHYEELLKPVINIVEGNN